MDRSREYNAKRSKSVRERQIAYDFTRVESKKRTKEKKKKKDKPKKQTLNYREQTDGYQRGSGWVGGRVKQLKGIKSTLVLMSTE